MVANPTIIILFPWNKVCGKATSNEEFLIENRVYSPIYWAPSSVIARSEATKQSREGYEIATPRQVGARNDKSVVLDESSFGGR